MQTSGNYVVAMYEKQGRRVGYLLYQGGKRAVITVGEPELKNKIKQQPYYVTNVALQSDQLVITMGAEENYPVIEMQDMEVGQSGNIDIRGIGEKVIKNEDTLVMVEDHLQFPGYAIAVSVGGNARGTVIKIPRLDLPKYKYANVDLCRKTTNINIERDGGHFYLRGKRAVVKK